MYVPVGPFKDTYVDFLQPVEQALAGGGPPAYEAILKCYTGLLQQWGLSAKSQNATHNLVDQTVFEALANHVSTLSLSLLLTIPIGQCQPLISTIISYLEVLSPMSELYTYPIMLPPTHLIYLLALHTSVTTLSRTCGIIASYKIAIEAGPRPIKDHYPKNVPSNLNAFLKDLYDMLWKTRKTETIDERAVAMRCDPALRITLDQHLRGIDSEYSILDALKMSYHPSIASMSAHAWRAMEDAEIERQGYDRSSIRYHSGPVSQKSLEVLGKNGGVSVEYDHPHGYRMFVLEWMADRGLTGMSDLMVNTVAKKKKQEGEST